MWRHGSIVVALVLAVVCVYGQTAGFDFVDYDDRHFVTENPAVLRGLTPATLAWAFTTPHASQYMPLTWLSHALDCSVWGLEAGGHHLTSVALHAAATGLLYGLLALTTGAVWASAAVAAAFALHPLHVESVAWIAERKDVLSTTFGLLTFWAWVTWTRRPSARRYCTALLCLALGLLSKPMLVTMPVLLLLFDAWPLGRLDPRRGRELARRALEKVPFLLLALGATALAVHAATGRALTARATIPIGDRLANALVSYAWYVHKLVWPTDLAVLYPHPSLQGGTPLTAGHVLAAAALLGAVTALAWRTRSRIYPLVGWLFFLVALLPVIGLTQAGIQARADRYTYLAYTGLFIWIAWGVRDWLARAPTPARRAAVAGAAAVALTALGVRAADQTRVWRDSITLYEHALAVTGRNFMMHFNLATVRQARDEFGEAIGHYRAALAIEPRHAPAHFGLAQSLARAGEADEALEHYAAAARIDPRHAPAQRAWADALAEAARWDEAVVVYQAGLALDPADHHAHNNLGNALLALGRHDEAARAYRAALATGSAGPGVETNLGLALEGAGDPAAAAAAYRRAIALDRNGHAPHAGLGRVLFDRDPAEAEGALRTAVRLDPTDVESHLYLAWALATTVDANDDDRRDALRHARTAVRLTGGSAAALQARAVAEAALGRFARARSTIARARSAPGAAGDLGRQLDALDRRFEERRPWVHGD